MKEKDLEIYDVWESPNGNVFIKMTEEYSIAIGVLGCHEPNENDNKSPYIKKNDITPVKKVGRVMFNADLRKRQILFAEYCMTKLLTVKPKDSDLPEISGENLSRIQKILKEFRK